MIKNIYDIFVLTDKYYAYLKDKNIEFDSKGFPVFTEEMFLSEWPNLVVPYSQRKNKRVTNRKKTVICFYDKDQKLYPRAEKVFDEIEELKSFMGVIGLDITITDDMDEEFQKSILLLNQLYMAILAVNNIKIIFNTRSGSLNCDNLFNNVPQGTMVASGFLGCSLISTPDDYSYLKKILCFLPERLILYGKHDKVVENQLNMVGIDYKVYPDFHRLCQEVYYGR